MLAQNESKLTKNTEALPTEVPTYKPTIDNTSLNLGQCTNELISGAYPSPTQGTLQPTLGAATGIPTITFGAIGDQVQLEFLQEYAVLIKAEDCPSFIKYSVHGKCILLTCIDNAPDGQAYQLDFTYQSGLSSLWADPMIGIKGPQG